MPYGISNKNIDQQKFGIDRPKATPPEYTGGETYIEGVGNLGPDIEGYGAGVKALQEYQLAEAGNARAEEQLGMDKVKLGIDQDYLKIAQQDLGIRLSDSAMRQEEFGWKREDRARQMEIQQGMMNAVQADGYTGVIEYLKTIDPERAVQFHAEKLKLDNSIMTNEVAKAALPNELDKIQFESYGILGKMGTAILQAPPEMRDQMYQQILPMIKKVVPDAPDKLNDQATSMFLLGASQMTDANQLASYTMSAEKITDAIGKNEAAIKVLENQGQQNSEEYKIRVAQRQKYIAESEVAQVKQTQAALNKINTDTSITNKKFMATRQIQNDLDKQSKGFTELVETYSKTKPLIEQIKKDPKNAGMARIMLRKMVVRMVEKGPMTESDYEQASSARGADKLGKKFRAIMTGQEYALNDQEVDQMALILDDLVGQQYKNQLSREAKFRDMIGTEFNSLVNYDNVVKPSKTFEQIVNPNYPKPTKQDLEMLQKNPNLKDKFIKHFGFDPTGQQQ